MVVIHLELFGLVICVIIGFLLPMHINVEGFGQWRFLRDLVLGDRGLRLIRRSKSVT